MKKKTIFVLTKSEMCDAHHLPVEVFILHSYEQAQEEMQKQYDELLKDWEYEPSNEDGYSYLREFAESHACVIVEDAECRWNITKHEV